MGKIIKSRKMWKIIGVVIILMMSYGLGNSTASVQLKKEKLKYNEIQSEISNVEEKLMDSQDKLENINAELTSKKSEAKEAIAAINSKDQISDQINKLSKELSEKQGQIENLDANIKEKQSELEKLTSGVKAKEEEPRTFSAGQYIVGNDFPEGRYKAVPVGEGSNFQVFNGSSGIATVNTILGSGRYSEKEYVFFTSNGDIMETQATVQLIPIE